MKPELEKTSKKRSHSTKKIPRSFNISNIIVSIGPYDFVSYNMRIKRSQFSAETAAIIYSSLNWIPSCRSDAFIRNVT